MTVGAWTGAREDGGGDGGGGGGDGSDVAFATQADSETNQGKVSFEVGVPQVITPGNEDRVRWGALTGSPTEYDQNPTPPNADNFRILAAGLYQIEARFQLSFGAGPTSGSITAWLYGGANGVTDVGLGSSSVPAADAANGEGSIFVAVGQIWVPEDALPYEFEAWLMNTSDVDIQLGGDAYLIARPIYRPLA